MGNFHTTNFFQLVFVSNGHIWIFILKSLYWRFVLLMCTIIFSTSKCKIDTEVYLIKRSRDIFGCYYNFNKIITSDNFNEIHIFLSHIKDKQFKFMHGRAIPESEPDYFKPDYTLSQPQKINDNILFGFHGLITGIKNYNFDKNKSDTLQLKDFLTEHVNTLRKCEVDKIHKL